TYSAAVAANPAAMSAKASEVSATTMPTATAAMSPATTMAAATATAGVCFECEKRHERIEGLASELETLARRDAGCERLMSVPGIGAIISSAMVAAIGTGDAFTKGRDFDAWLGLVPKQISTYQAEDLGSSRAQALARSGQEAAASQRPRHRARQQARPHCL